MNEEKPDTDFRKMATDLINRVDEQVSGFDKIDLIEDCVRTVSVQQYNRGWNEAVEKCAYEGEVTGYEFGCGIKIGNEIRRLKKG